MLQDNAPFRQVWQHLGRSTSVASFVQFIEKKLGASFVYNKSTILFGRDDLADLFEIAQKLKEAGIIKEFGPSQRRPDEPPLYLWLAYPEKKKNAAGGGSFGSDRDALAAALAEALERYLWSQETDYFVSPITATVEAMKKRHACIEPRRFAGFSEAQRNDRKELHLDPDAKYLWTKGYSWVSGRPVMIPAQTVSGWHGSSVSRKKANEPLILEPISTGLATWPTREGAALRGALEILERDALMIMWFNQLSLPRINLESLASKDEEIKNLLEKCEQYRLSVNVVNMITDAPTHALCAVIEDKTQNQPRITVGLKAGASLVKTAKGAIIESLRVRNNARRKIENPPEERDAEKDEGAVRHTERLLYWTVGDRNKRLLFLKEGKTQSPEEKNWENDDDQEHLQRITAWCREKNYELASASIGKSSKNPTSWHVEMVAMPEMQPLHQNEKNIYLGGKRLKDIPEMFGYEAREKPFADEPHPFA